MERYYQGLLDQESEAGHQELNKSQSENGAKGLNGDASAQEKWRKQIEKVIR